MFDGRMRVLLIGNENDVFLVRNALVLGTKPSYEIDHAASVDVAVGFMEGNCYDVVLLDLELAGSSGDETLRHLQEVCQRQIPVVVLSGSADEDTAMVALREGAQDYIIKDTMKPETLSRSMRYALQRHQMRKQLKAANKLLEEQNDHLAQLYGTAQQFVDNVSHEFRTPLTVIREFTSIIRDGLDGPVTSQQANHLDTVLHRTDDLALMVDDMLDVSRLEAGSLGMWRRPCSAAKLVEDVFGLLEPRAASKHINLSIHVASHLPEVYCDGDKVQRVIINLTINAIKFTPEGGQVCIWTKLADVPDEVLIGVSDSGPGMSPGDLKVIFQRFRQLNGNSRSSGKGFGLGLNIVSELVRLNLGTLHVESQRGQGSTFSFTLPRNDMNVVIDRYAAWLTTDTEAMPQVSLIAGCVDDGPRVVAESLVLADEFLHRSVRATDLVLRAADRVWVVAASCEEQGADELVARLSGEWEHYARNCPEASLPPIHFTVHGSWNVGQQGACFRRELGELTGTSGVAPGRTRTILVVDDDPEVSSCLNVRLRAAGFEVIAAADGEEGLSSALSNRLDAVVLDIRMPKKNGLEVLRELRAFEGTADLPVVMLSANIRDRHAALEAGANYFVAKPYEAKSVLTAIESAIRKRGAHEHEFHSVDRR